MLVLLSSATPSGRPDRPAPGARRKPNGQQGINVHAAQFCLSAFRTEGDAGADGHVSASIWLLGTYSCTFTLGIALGNAVVYHVQPSALHYVDRIRQALAQHVRHHGGRLATRDALRRSRTRGASRGGDGRGRSLGDLVPEPAIRS